MVNTIQNTSVNINNQSFINIRQQIEKNQDKINQDNVNSFEKQIKDKNDINEYYVEKQISFLADKFEKYHIYTKEASKVVAEQIIKGTIKFIA